MSEYAVSQTQFRDPAILAAALTDMGFAASVIEWHDEPVRLTGPTIEVASYAEPGRAAGRKPTGAVRGAGR